MRNRVFDSANSKETKLSTKYKIRDQTKLHFITFAVVEWVDVFTRRIYKNALIDSLTYCQENSNRRKHPLVPITNINVCYLKI